jgi:flagellin-like protein
MKKIWKMRKNREAVSPVIATILMVAITVVLAAVLYVMVMGFGALDSDARWSLRGHPGQRDRWLKLTFRSREPDTRLHMIANSL